MTFRGYRHRDSRIGRRISQTTKVVDGKLTMTNVKRYPAAQINPPDGVKSEAWLKSGFKAP